MEPITVTDAADPRLADYGGLRDPNHRVRLESNEFFVIEGITAISRLATSLYHPRSVLLTPHNFQRLKEVLHDMACPIYIAEKALMATVAGYEIHRGAIASANRGIPKTLHDVLRTSRTVAILEGLNDHENLGAIARSARALGVDALLLDPQCADPYYRRCVRVSMGEVLHLTIARLQDWPADLDVVEEHGFRLIALTPHPSATPLAQVIRRPDERVAVLLGAEGPGLNPATLARSTQVRIPINPDVDSLNVGHAAAVAFAQLGLINWA